MFSKPAGQGWFSHIPTNENSFLWTGNSAILLHFISWVCLGALMTILYFFRSYITAQKHKNDAIQLEQKEVGWMTTRCKELEIRPLPPPSFTLFVIRYLSFRRFGDVEGKISFLPRSHQDALERLPLNCFVAWVFGVDKLAVCFAAYITVSYMYQFADFKSPYNSTNTQKILFISMMFIHVGVQILKTKPDTKVGKGQWNWIALVLSPDTKKRFVDVCLSQSASWLFGAAFSVPTVLQAVFKELLDQFYKMSTLPKTSTIQEFFHAFLTTNILVICQLEYQKSPPAWDFVFKCVVLVWFLCVYFLVLVANCYTRANIIQVLFVIIFFYELDSMFQYALVFSFCHMLYTSWYYPSDLENLFHGLHNKEKRLYMNADLLLVIVTLVKFFDPVSPDLVWDALLPSWMKQALKVCGYISWGLGILPVIRAIMEVETITNWSGPCFGYNFVKNVNLLQRVYGGFFR